MTTSPLRHRLRTATSVLAVGAAAVLIADLVLPAHAAAPSLAEAASAAGKTVGVAMSSRLLSDTTYTGIVDREFTTITPEVEFTFEATESVRNTFAFSAGDSLVLWAQAHGKSVRGWGPLYGIQRPLWLASLTPAQQRAEAMRHLSTVLGHYRGKVSSWDVVTEEVTDEGILRNDLLNRTGSDWMDEAFATAHAADPDADLCYGDYNIEDWTTAKTQKVYQLLKDLRARGVPVTCVGIEGHFTGGTSYPSTMRTTLTQFAALGLTVHLTQVDVTGNSTQASVYAKLVEDCQAVPRCASITVWGVRDRDSWRSSDSPVLFDSSGNPKPAYYAMRDAFVPTTPPTSTGPVTTTTTSPTKTSPTKTSPTTTSPTTKTKSTKPKPTRTVCRTKKKDGSVTCKTITRK